MGPPPADRPYLAPVSLLAVDSENGDRTIAAKVLPNVANLKMIVVNDRQALNSHILVRTHGLNKIRGRTAHETLHALGYFVMQQGVIRAALARGHDRARQTWKRRRDTWHPVIDWGNFARQPLDDLIRPSIGNNALGFVQSGVLPVESVCYISHASLPVFKAGPSTRSPNCWSEAIRSRRNLDWEKGWAPSFPENQASAYRRPSAGNKAHPMNQRGLEAVETDDAWRLDLFYLTCRRVAPEKTALAGIPALIGTDGDTVDAATLLTSRLDFDDIFVRVELVLEKLVFLATPIAKGGPILVADRTRGRLTVLWVKVEGSFETIEIYSVVHHDVGDPLDPA